MDLDNDASVVAIKGNEWQRSRWNEEYICYVIKLTRTFEYTPILSCNTLTADSSCRS